MERLFTLNTPKPAQNTLNHF